MADAPPPDPAKEPVPPPETLAQAAAEQAGLVQGWHIAGEVVAMVTGMVTLGYQLHAYFDKSLAKPPDLSSEQAIAGSFTHFAVVTMVGIVLFLLGFGRIAMRLIELADEEDENPQ